MAKKVDLKHSHHKGKNLSSYAWWRILNRLIGMILSQYIQISNHYVVYSNIILYVNCISKKSNQKKNNILWHVKAIWSSNFSVHIILSEHGHTHPSTYVSGCLNATRAGLRSYNWDPMSYKFQNIDCPALHAKKISSLCCKLQRYWSWLQPQQKWLI